MGLTIAPMANVPTTAYGADAAGLICGYRITPGAQTQAVGSADAVAWLAEPVHAGGSFLWLHFNLAHTGARPWLAEHAALSDEFFAVVDDGLHSTRIERRGSGSWSASSPPSPLRRASWRFESAAKTERYTAPAQLREAPCSRTS
jgi:hypothetical protein